MPHGTARYRYTGKPGPGSTLNLRHPLSAGLVRVWLLNQNGAMADADALTSTLVSVKGSATLNHNGCYVASASSSNYAVLQTSKIVGDQLNWTIAFKMNSTASTGNGITVYSERASSGNDICKINFGRTGAGTNAAEITYRNDGGSLIQMVGTKNVRDGADHIVVATRSGAIYTLYVDGPQDAQNTGGPSTAAFTEAVETWLMGDKGDNTSHMSGSVYWCYVWNRTLSAEEARQLAENEYVLINPPALILHGRMNVDPRRRGRGAQLVPGPVRPSHA